MDEKNPDLLLTEVFRKFHRNFYMKLKMKLKTLEYIN